MRFEPGFVKSLRNDIEKIDDVTKANVDTPGGLAGADLISLVWHPRTDSVYMPVDMKESEMTFIVDDNLSSKGAAALADGNTAICLMLNGEDEHTQTFFDTLKTIQTRHIWALAYFDSITKETTNSLLAIENIKIVMGYESYALSPDNRIIFSNSMPLLYPCGSGDVIPALRESCLLNEFIANGGKNIVFVKPSITINELLTIVGHHIETHAGFTCEVTPRIQNDERCVVAWNDGILQAILPGRIEGNVDIADYSWATTGTCVLNLKESLRNTQEFVFRRRRTIKNKRIIIEHKRSLLELTEHVQTHFVCFTNKE